MQPGKAGLTLSLGGVLTSTVRSVFEVSNFPELMQVYAHF